MAFVDFSYRIVNGLTRSSMTLIRVFSRSVRQNMTQWLQCPS